ncbi:hypothetical protein E4U59_000106 [Claviceps monticola]|nr:hypothetical protein E4U59_000106 [Claviceps monticola]
MKSRFRIDRTELNLTINSIHTDMNSNARFTEVQFYAKSDIQMETSSPLKPYQHGQKDRSNTSFLYRIWMKRHIRADGDGYILARIGADPNNPITEGRKTALTERGKNVSSQRFHCIFCVRSILYYISIVVLNVWNVKTQPAGY